MGKQKHLSGFKRGMIVGARLSGSSLNEVAALTNVSIKTVSQLAMTTQARKRIHYIVSSNKCATVAQITEIFNSGQDKPISTRTMRRELQKQRIMDRTQLPSSLEQLHTALLDEWHKIPPEVYVHAVQSMPHRITVVIQAKGGPTQTKVIL
uniref:Transposase n=1 Tax=Eptatretus burgeri TaxID=7764 RepID=A0A8C4N3R5_EPTBU